MTDIYSTVLVVAPLENVPPKGYAVAEKQAERIKAQHPDRIKLAETFDEPTKQAFRDVFGPHWNWNTAPGQSAMQGVDTRVWQILHRYHHPGMAGRALRGVNDRRDVFGWKLRHRKTGRKIVDYVIHPGPIPTRKAPWMVPAALAEHGRVWKRLRHLRSALPTSLGGDWNAARAKTRPDLRRGRGIVHEEMHNGKYSGFSDRTTASTFGLPGSNHRALRVTQRMRLIG